MGSLPDSRVSVGGGWADARPARAAAATMMKDFIVNNCCVFVFVLFLTSTERPKEEEWQKMNTREYSRAK